MRELLMIVALATSCSTQTPESPVLEGAPIDIAGRATVEAGSSPDIVVLRPEATDITLCLTGTEFGDKFAVGDVVEIAGEWQSAPALRGEHCMKFSPRSVIAAR